MNKQQLANALEELLAQLRQYRDLLVASRNPYVAEIERNHDQISKQQQSLMRAYGRLRKYIELFSIPKVGTIAGHRFLIYETALGSGTLIVRGQALDAFIGNINTALGELEGMDASEFYTRFSFEKYKEGSGEQIPHFKLRIQLQKLNKTKLVSNPEHRESKEWISDTLSGLLAFDELTGRTFESASKVLTQNSVIELERILRNATKGIKVAATTPMPKKEPSLQEQPSTVSGTTRLIEKIKQHPIIAWPTFILFIAGIIFGLWSLFRPIYYVAMRDKNELKIIQRLSANAQLTVFTELLGNPVLEKPVGSFKSEVFVRQKYYVETITDNQNTVVAYTVTTRDATFNPSFTLGPYSNTGTATVKLGISRFTVLDSLGFRSEIAQAMIGARRFFYGEEHYFGNPGNYQYYILSFNDAGYGIDFLDVPLGDAPQPGLIALPNLWAETFRKNNVVNSITITAPYFSWKEIDEKAPLGADLDEVRVLNQ